ncbi:hypothetical protein Tco_1165649 [Tanacetum coccineum]
MNKLTGRGDVDVSQPRKPARGILKPMSNNNMAGPRVYESNTQVHTDYSEPTGLQSGMTNAAAEFSKSSSFSTPTSRGESLTMNPSSTTNMEGDASLGFTGLAEGDGISVSRMAGSFVSKVHDSSIAKEDNTISANKGTFTSLGESTVWSTMNPSNGSKSDIEEHIWSTVLEPPESTSNVDTQPCAFTNSNSFNNNGPNTDEPDYIRPTGWTLGNQSDVPTEINIDTPIVKFVEVNMNSTSYANAAGARNVNQPTGQANFRPMVAEKVFDGVNISIPRKVVEKVSVRFENTLYGYFIGKRIAFPVVEFYARNNWGKHGLKRIMMNAKCFFFFKFDTLASLDAVLEGVVNKKRNNKGKSVGNNIPKGVPVSKGFQVGKDFAFQPRAPNAGSNGSSTHGQASSKAEKDVVDSSKIKISNIATPNPFAALGVDEDEEEDIENIYDESAGASTPAQMMWKWTSNGSLCPKDSQIILGWNDDLVDVMIMAQTNQVMHVQLWNNLVGHSRLMRNRPWVLLGDFNAALNLEDHSAGGYEPNAAMRDFKECVQAMKPYRISDRSPCVLRIPMITKPKPKPFKISNFLIYKEGFRKVVESGWALNVDGCNMYRVVKRLKGLKSPFRKLLHNQDNLHNRVDLLRKELDETQKAIYKDPHNPDLREEHAHYLLAFKEASLNKERGHPSFVDIIMQGLEDFKNVSGLVPSIPKSIAFFCNVPNALKATILNSMLFAEGSLPVRYLGVPLISSRLLYRDCKILVEKLESRINEWRNKFLSIAGKLKKGKAKVAWESVCKPNLEGGLGIRRHEDFNVALMATHIWSILTHKESLWVKWIHSYKLKGRSFWDVPCLGDVSWGWRKLLQIRPLICPFIWNSINNGKLTSTWFDKWHNLCPIRNLLTNRDITRSGFGLKDSVSDYISNGNWRWPTDWLDKVPGLSSIPVLNLIDIDDVRLWHAFHLWLVAKQKLKTQDRLRQWDVWLQVRSLAEMDQIPPRFADISIHLIPTSKGKSVIVQEEGVYRSTDHISYFFYGSFEAGYLQVQEGVYSVPSFIRSMEDPKLLYGS